MTLMTLSIHGDFGPLTVRVGVSEDWTGTAHVRVTRWADDNTEEYDYSLVVDVEDALRGLPRDVPVRRGVPPLSLDGIPLDVWGAVVALLVRERARLTMLQAVQRALGASR